MANYQNLKAAISAAIRTNGNQEITGQVLQDVLNSIVSVIGANYTFAGVATPATNPGTPDQNVMYLAMEGGTYTNFNGTVLPAGISLLMWNGTWRSETVMCGDGGVFDISVYKSSGGTLAKFADLAAALDGGNNIPASARKGGMSVKFVCSSDNNYVQFRCMSQNFSIKVADWQKENPLDVFIPIKGSVSIIGDSISTYNGTLPSGYVTYYPNASLDVTSQNDMWWQKILSMSAVRLDTNASYSGSMVTNGRASQGMPDFYDRCNIIGTPDNIFVALGTNDSGTSTALGEYDYDSAISDLSEEQFIPAYIKGIKALKENYPSANIFLFIFSMKETYADVIKNIGEHYNLPVIDVRSYYTNNAHPDKNGMFKIVQDVCSYFDLRVDNTPSVNSNRLVKSGGVFSAIEEHKLNINKSTFNFKVTTGETIETLPFPIKYGDKFKIKLNDISTTQTCIVKYIDANYNVLDTIYLISSQGGESSGIYRKNTNAVFVSLFDNATTNSVSFDIVRDGNISESISIAEEKIQNLRDFDGVFYDKYAVNEYNQIITPLKTPLDNVKYQVSISPIETPVGVYVVKFYDDEGTVYPDNNGISLFSGNNWSWSAGNRQWENITKMLIYANNSNDYSKHIKIEQTLRKEDTSFADTDESSPISWEITTPVLLKASIKKGDIVLFDVDDKTNNHTFVVQPRLTADGSDLRTYYFTKRDSSQYGESFYDIKRVMLDDSEYLNIWDNNGAKTAKITWYKQGTLAYKNFVNDTERAILTKPLSFVGSVINNMTNPVQSMVELANSLKWKQSVASSVSLNRPEDKMIHGSSMVVNSQGKVFIINVANQVDNTEDNLDPNVYLRLTTFNIDTPQDREYYEIQRCGQTYDLLDGGTITISSARPSYDPQIICDDNDNIWILFSVFNDTTQTRDMYRSLWDDVNHTQKLSKCTYDYKGSTYDLSTANINSTIAVDYKFGTPDIVNSTPGMHCTYAKRVESGQTWYYIGYVVGPVPVVFRTQNFISYEFYAAPDYRQFDANYNISDIQFEMPVTWLNNNLICEIRMSGMGNQRITRGIMMKYNATTEKWEEYIYIPDSNSRGTFINYNGIYLFHNINDRSTAALRKVDVWNDILAATFDVQYCNLDTQICYLDTIIYNGELYAVWTSGTKSDIRFGKLPILEVSETDVVQKLSNLLLD